MVAKATVSRSAMREGIPGGSDRAGPHYPAFQAAEAAGVIRWIPAGPLAPRIRPWLRPAPLLLLAMGAVVNGAESEPRYFPLWDGPAPGTAGATGPETFDAEGRVRNVSTPGIDVYLPERSAKASPAIIICSGGGYAQLAVKRCGQGLGAAVLPRGIAVISLKYRVSRASRDTMLNAVMDGRRALRLVRSHAKEWNIDPRQVGMVGFSAGANLLMNLAFTPEGRRPASMDPVESQRAVPDFLGLFSTWPNGQKVADLAITAQCPPVFLGITQDDTTAPPAFSASLREALEKARVPVEFLSYPDGGHTAFNFGAGKHQDWPPLLLAWLEGRGAIAAPAENAK